MAHNGAKTECKRGHAFTPENTYIAPHTGFRICRACVRDKAKGKLPKPAVMQERAILSLEETRAALLADLRMAGETRRTPEPARRDGDTLLVVEVVDAHLGSLCWPAETGDAPYDLAIAARLYRQTVERLLARAERDQPAAIILRVGDDYLHVDSDLNQTTAGTPQDVDSRFQKVFRMGVSCAAWAARRCAEIAPTKVVTVPGNHDSHAALALGAVLEAMFESHPDITVIPSVTQRIYQQWGTTLLLFVHGDKELPQTLPLVMAAEQPDAWARTTCREIHLGHLHRKRQMSADEFCGVRVRWLPSIKATDAWHASKGYIGAQRAAEAHLYSAARGYLGSLSEPIDAAA